MCVVGDWYSDVVGVYYCTCASEIRQIRVYLYCCSSLLSTMTLTIMIIIVIKIVIIIDGLQAK